MHKRKTIYSVAIALIMALTVIAPIAGADNAYAASKPGTPKYFYNTYAKWSDHGGVGMHTQWYGVKGAKGYQVKQYGKYITTKTWHVKGTGASCEPNHWSKVKKNFKGKKLWISMKVRAYKTNKKGKKIYGNWSKAQAVYLNW